MKLYTEFKTKTIVPFLSGFQAFTLAEVLITLGIIGIVAAITVPTLIQNYNMKTWNTSATVFEQKLEIALKTMNAQQTLAGHNSTESFVEELSKHLKANKICDNDNLLDCFTKTVWWGAGEATPEEVDMSIIKTSKNFGQTSWKTNVVGVQFANGVSALIAYNPLTSGDNICEQNQYSNQITGKNCLAILYDTSGEKNPNTIGKDLRANHNVSRLGSGCAIEIGDTCYIVGPFLAAPMSYEECAGENATTAGTVTEAGSYAKSLGISTCRYENDYWAGAVKTCGGTDKLPTQAQLTEIANYVYNTNNITSDGTTENLTLDTEKVLSLGYKLTSSKSFNVWAGKEAAGHLAYLRYFNATKSYWHYGNRGYENLFTMCVDN